MYGINEAFKQEADSNIFISNALRIDRYLINLPHPSQVLWPDLFLYLRGVHRLLVPELFLFDLIPIEPNRLYRHHHKLKRATVALFGTVPSCKKERNHINLSCIIIQPNNNKKILNLFTRILDHPVLDQILV